MKKEDYYLSSIGTVVLVLTLVMSAIHLIF